MPTPANDKGEPPFDSPRLHSNRPPRSRARPATFPVFAWAAAIRDVFSPNAINPFSEEFSFFIFASIPFPDFIPSH